MLTTRFWCGEPYRAPVVTLGHERLRDVNLMPPGVRTAPLFGLERAMLDEPGCLEFPNRYITEKVVRRALV
jgi:hypothetical protein